MDRAELTCLGRLRSNNSLVFAFNYKRKKALSFHNNKALNHTSKLGFWDSCIPFKNSPLSGAKC